MRILFLSISAGQGHHTTAAAAAEELTARGCEVIVMDALEFINPLLSESVEKGYLITTRYTPAMYGGAYRLAEKIDRKEKERERFGVSKFTSALLCKNLTRFINNFRPRIIVCTHIFAAQLVTHIHSRINSPKTVGIITDFTIHPFWEDTNLDYYVTASHLLNNQCSKKGMPLEKVKPFGIPIQKKFATSVTKTEAREQLGIGSDLQTILVVMGSMGYGNVTKTIRKIDALDMDFQVLCVTGRNAKARKNVLRLATKHRVYAYGYVDNLDLMMDAADIIVTKPGGLTVSEALAKGLPMILTNPIPGQEHRNIEFLLNNGLASFVTSTFPVDEALYQMLSNKWRDENLATGVRYIGKPNATCEFADFVMKL